MAAIAPASTTQFLELLRKSNILGPARLGQVPTADDLPADPKKASAYLIQQGLLTPFQAGQLLIGRHKGFRIGQYAIQNLLGRGGMGAVYQAEHMELGRKVALKLLAPVRGEGGKLATERFLREARAASALDHPNIVRVFDVARHQDTPYLIMEYVDGESLQQFVDREGTMPVDEAAECVAQAAAGLQHAHERGFVHRDIKPGNLVRDAQGVVKILDMGLARSNSAEDKLTELLDAGAVVGTADYISPEQAINSPHLDGRADIYSLGATLFTLLAGRPPFEGNTAQKLTQHQLKDPPSLTKLRPNLPPSLVAVVVRMLAKKPADRFQSGAEVVAALAPWSGGSARVVAGMSRTSLGQSATRLNRIGLSGASLPALPDRGPGESGVVDTSGAEHATGELRADETVKNPRTPRPAPPPRKPRGVVYALAAALVLAVGVGGWLATRGPKKPATDAADPPPSADPGPLSPSAAKPPADPAAPRPPRAEESVSRLAPSELTEFRVRMSGGNVLSGKRGALPAGVAYYALKDGEAEFAVEPVDGSPVFSIRRHSATGDIHLALELEREASAPGMGLRLQPGTDYLLRVQYRTEGDAQLLVSVHTFGYKSRGSKPFPKSADRWATAELEFARGADPVRATLAALGSPGGRLTLGKIELVEVKPER